MLKKNRDSKVKALTGASKVRNLKLSQSKDDVGAISLNTKPLSTKHENEATGPKIPRNVNFYRHLITDNHCNEHEINWVLELRPIDGKKRNKMEPTTLAPFAFDGKTIEAQKDGRLISDLDGKNELHQVNHLYLHRIGATPSQGSVQFETGLRSYGASSDKLKTLERTWKNNAKKDRKEFPTMYPSYEETNKIKQWSTKNLTIQTHTAFEGHLTYPKYGELYDRQVKNVSEVRHLLRGANQFMATADWQLSMRQYGNPQKTPKQNNEDQPASLGELKKVNKKPGRL